MKVDILFTEVDIFSVSSPQASKSAHY